MLELLAAVAIGAVALVVLFVGESARIDGGQMAREMVEAALGRRGRQVAEALVGLALGVFAGFLLGYPFPDPVIRDPTARLAVGAAAPVVGGLLAVVVGRSATSGFGQPFDRASWMLHGAAIAAGIAIVRTLMV